MFYKPKRILNFMTEKVTLLLSSLLLVLLIGLIASNQLGKEEINVSIDLNDDENPFEAIKRILPTSSVVCSVTEVDRATNKYTLKVTAVRKGLLERILSNNIVEEARLLD